MLTTVATRVLTLSAVTVDLDGHTALHGVNAEARAGRLLAVVGPNGSGKSTLLSVAAGLLIPSTGSAERPKGTRVALVPQSTHLPPHLPLTVRDVVTMGTWATLGAWRPSRRADRARVRNAIDAVGLAGLAHRPIGAVSGGQRQRTLLAQALVQRADLVLLDEPMAGLDTASRSIIADAVTRLTSAGAAVIAVTHDLTEFRRIDDLLELDDGRVVERPSTRCTRSGTATRDETG